MTGASWLFLAAGTLAGGLSRFALGSAVHRLTGTAFPLGTLAVNGAGCVIVGFLSAAGGARFNLNQEARLLLVTGFCGAFTTFSAFILETAALVRAGSSAQATAYVAATLALGFTAFAAGLFAGRAL